MVILEELVIDGGVQPKTLYVDGIRPQQRLAEDDFGAQTPTHAAQADARTRERLKCSLRDELDTAAVDEQKGLESRLRAEKTHRARGVL